MSPASKVPPPPHVLPPINRSTFFQHGKLWEALPPPDAAPGSALEVPSRGWGSSPRGNLRSIFNITAQGSALVWRVRSRLGGTGGDRSLRLTQRGGGGGGTQGEVGEGSQQILEFFTGTPGRCLSTDHCGFDQPINRSFNPLTRHLESIRGGGGAYPQSQWARKHPWRGGQQSQHRGPVAPRPLGVQGAS